MSRPYASTRPRRDRLEAVAGRHHACDYRWTAPRPTRRPVHAARHPAGGRCPHPGGSGAVPMPRHCIDPMTSRRCSCGTVGRCWRTFGTWAGSRISYTSPTGRLPSQADYVLRLVRQGRESGTGAAGERDKQVTSPGPAAPVCPRWAMHAGPATASSRAGETGPPGPGLMRSPQGVSVERGRCLTFCAGWTVSQAC
jgi:hypothetical protein